VFVLTVLGLAELATRSIQFRRFGPNSQRPETLRDRWTVVRNNPAFARRGVTHNAQGFRRMQDVPVVKPAGTVRVFLLGGSVTYGAEGLYREIENRPEPRNDETIDYYLEQRLNREFPAKHWEVVNAGVKGYLLNQDLALLLSVILRYKPDYVISLDGVNDLSSLLRAPPLYDPYLQPELVDDFNRLANPSTLASLRVMPTAWLRNNSVLFFTVQNWISNRARERRRRERAAATVPNPVRFADLSPGQQDQYRTSAEQLDSYLNPVRQMHELLAAAGIEDLFVLQPEILLTRKPWIGSESRLLDYHRKVESRVFLYGFETLYPELGAHLAEDALRLGYGFLDLTGVFDGMAVQTYSDFCHLTPGGDEVIANRIFSRLRNTFRETTSHDVSPRERLANPAAPAAAIAVHPRLMHITLDGRTVHNSHYLAESFLYQLQMLVGTEADSRKVLGGDVVHREGRELYIDLNRVPTEIVTVLQGIARCEPPADDISLGEMNAYTQNHYYELSRPYPTLQALLKEHSYRNNPNWLTVPVDSATFQRLRVLHINKDRIADALMAYFENDNRLIYPLGTTIVAESFDKRGKFVEAEVLRKRRDTFWNFSVYDSRGALIKTSFAFDEEGELAPDRTGLKVPQDCAICHRLDRLDLSGDADNPVLSPVRGFFHKLPARVPQIHLGPEYYDHMAFTELTEANAKVKDGVFGVYGSLLLSELAGRKRLGTLTREDKARYTRLMPSYPELLTSLDRIDSVTNSIGMRLIRIPAPGPRSVIGSLTSDPEHRSDEQRHPVQFQRGFFMSMYKQTNAEFRRFRRDHHSPPYRDVALDADDQPVVNISYYDAQAFVDWLNHLPAERTAGRTYRLPTEEEWEYAAKGGDGRRFPWGDQWPPPDGSGNFADEANGGHFRWEYLHGYRDPYLATSPVGKFFPNAYFLYDMAGNAYEWTSSSYDRYPGTPAGVNPPGSTPYGAQSKIMRGSSWADELPKVLRCAFRLPVSPDTRMQFGGFRVIADIPDLR
jgi:formylglycine-generating enzyme required for sulfatase activity/lysophospholipase L1-like esterase